MSSYRCCVGSRNRSWGSSGSGWDRIGEASLQRPRDTPCRGRMRTGHAEPHRRQGHGAAGGVAQAVVNSVESEGDYCSEVTAERPAPVQVGQGPCSRAPAEAAIALAMDMVAVVGDLVVDGLLREGLEVNGLRSTQGFQHGIKTLPRPLEQAAEPMDGDPVKGRTQAVVGGLELLPEDLRVQEPCQLLLLVEPAAQGVAHGRVAGGWTVSMGRLPI
jgi:hypothetical protein